MPVRRGVFRGHDCMRADCAAANRGNAATSAAAAITPSASRRETTFIACLRYRWTVSQQLSRVKNATTFAVLKLCPVPVLGTVETLYGSQPAHGLEDRPVDVGLLQIRSRHIRPTQVRTGQIRAI